MKMAILNCPDTHPIESFRLMLATAGYETYVPGPALRARLHTLGMPLVQHWADLAHMGYLRPEPPVPEATTEDFERCDLFADLKVNGCRQLLANCPHLWCNIKDKVLWYRIQGGKPEVTAKCGNEIELPCPVLTANRWHEGSDAAYVCWLPFVRAGGYKNDRDAISTYSPPVLLIHSCASWGYSALLQPLIENTGLRCYGYGSPAGPVNNDRVAALLAKAVCYVQLRSNDSPGYACYEAIASRCPLVVPRRFVARMRVEDLYIEGETCLCFDTPDGDCHSVWWANGCVDEIRAHVSQLANPGENRRLGQAMYQRFQELCWSPERDGRSFDDFMRRHFL